MQKYVIIPESPNETAGKDVQNASGVSQKYPYPSFYHFSYCGLSDFPYLCSHE